MHRVVLVELGILLNLAHHDDDGGDGGEDAGIRGALVILPGIDEMRNALVKELGVDLDLCHLEKTGRGRWQVSDRRLWLLEEE